MCVAPQAAAPADDRYAPLEEDEDEALDATGTALAYEGAGFGEDELEGYEQQAKRSKREQRIEPVEKAEAYMLPEDDKYREQGACVVVCACACKPHGYCCHLRTHCLLPSPPQHTTHTLSHPPSHSPPFASVAAAAEPDQPERVLLKFGGAKREAPAPALVEAEADWIYAVLYAARFDRTQRISEWLVWACCCCCCCHCCCCSPCGVVYCCCCCRRNIHTAALHSPSFVSPHQKKKNHFLAANVLRVRTGPTRFSPASLIRRGRSKQMTCVQQ